MVTQVVFLLSAWGVHKRTNQASAFNELADYTGWQMECMWKEHKPLGVVSTMHLGARATVQNESQRGPQLPSGEDFRHLLGRWART